MKAIQEQEFEDAKRKDDEIKAKQLEQEMKEKEEKEQKLRAEEEAKRKKEENIENRKKTIPPEPQPNDPNSCEIAFRLPTGKKIIRRFPKTSTINV